MKTTEAKRAYARRYYREHREQMIEYYARYRRQWRPGPRDRSPLGDGGATCRLCGIRRDGARRPEDWTEVRGVGYCLDCARRVA